jgi:hypothetical protein
MRSPLGARTSGSGHGGVARVDRIGLKP